MNLKQPKAFNAKAPPPPLTLTPTEAAKQLHISRTKMYALLRQNVIPHVRLGRKILIPTQALTEWLHDHAVSTAADRKGGDADG